MYAKTRLWAGERTKLVRWCSPDCCLKWRSRNGDEMTTDYAKIREENTKRYRFIVVVQEIPMAGFPTLNEAVAMVADLARRHPGAVVGEGGEIFVKEIGAGA